jgi:hypothetical protein
MAKYETQYIRDEREVPDGYMALVEFDSQSLDHKRLSGAHAKGLIRAVKMMRSPRDHRSGKVWVHHQDAKAFLAAYDTQRAGHKPEPTAEAAVAAGIDKRHAEIACESLASMKSTMDEIYLVLERLTAAVESIATQPKAEPVGTWRDMNGESH